MTLEYLNCESWLDVSGKATPELPLMTGDAGESQQRQVLPRLELARMKAGGQLEAGDGAELELGSPRAKAGELREMLEVSAGASMERDGGEKRRAGEE